jgi:hypothetical protein
MKYLLLALFLSSCVATSGDLRGVADKIDAGASTSDALRSQAAGMDARSGGFINAIGMTGPIGGSIAAIAASIVAIYANDRKRDRNRVKRGEPVGSKAKETVA